MFESSRTLALELPLAEPQPRSKVEPSAGPWGCAGCMRVDRSRVDRDDLERGLGGARRQVAPATDHVRLEGQE